MRKKSKKRVFIASKLCLFFIFTIISDTYAVNTSSATECAQGVFDGEKILQRCEHPSTVSGTYSEKSNYEINTLSLINNSHTAVLPEVPTVVEMSNSDINRLICPEGLEAKDTVTDVVFSKEKGITTKIVGRNVFVKFKIIKKDNQEIFSTTPTELFVICGNTVYNIIAIPKSIPAKTITLSLKANKIKKNVEEYSSLPFEKKILKLIKMAYREEISDTFTIIEEGKKIDIYKDIDLILTRTVIIEGEGLRLKEYIATIKSDKSEISFREKDFLRSEVTTRPIAISLSKLSIQKGEFARIFIVEQEKEIK